MRGPSPLAGVILPSLFLLLSTSPSAAQPPPQPPSSPPAAAAKPPPAGKPGAPPPAVAAPASAAPPAADAGLPGPPKVEVNDPLLAPIPPPLHMINGWREALTLISSRSVDLAIAKQEVERAEGQRRQALGAALTTVTASVSISHQIIQSTTDRSTVVTPVFGQPGPDGMAPLIGQFSTTVPGRDYAGPTATAQLTASQPILALRTWYAIGTADLAIKSAKLSIEDKRRTSLTQIAVAIVSVYTNERIAEINRVGLKNTLQHLDLAQRKTRLGDGTRLDVLRAEQDVSQARSTIISSDEGLKKARETLGLALGSTEGYGIPPSISLNDMEQALRGSCAPGAPDQRADVVQARNELEVAKRASYDAKVLAFTPTASISTTLSTSNQSLGSGRDYAWSIQGVLTIPIWDGGSRYGAMRVARAGEEEAKIRADAATRNATIESIQSLRGVAVAEQAKLVAEQNRDLAHEAARLSEKAYAAGAGTSFDLVDTSRREREAELNLAVQEFELINAKIAALLATANCSY